MERHTLRNSCPTYTAAKNGNCLRRSLNWSSSVICACATNIEVADFPTTFSSVRITKMTGRSANASAIVFA